MINKQLKSSGNIIKKEKSNTSVTMYYLYPVLEIGISVHNPVASFKL